MTAPLARACTAALGLLLACALGCASNDPPSATAGVNRGGYYGGTIHSNSWPETYGHSGPYAIGRPAYRY